MATFTYVADFSAQRTTKPRVRSIKFGDGYEQRIADGINTVASVWGLTFNARTTTEADGIETFLRTEAGVSAFDWTPPSGSAGKYICREWQRTLDAFNVNSITATFEQVFG